MVTSEPRHCHTRRDFPIRATGYTLAPMPDAPSPIRVDRAPVLPLWAPVVAERLGCQPETLLTPSRFVAGSSARAKARRLGISDENQDAEERHARAAELKPRRQTIRLLGREAPRQTRGYRGIGSPFSDFVSQ
jgi:hypothetical protein